eukprot:XP_021126856.2 zinc finger and SCAN domain-containing protein 2-like [Anas platyrhynchos]
MADPVKLWESSRSQLNRPQHEQPSQNGEGESKESELKCNLLFVVKEDHQVLPELVVDRFEEEVVSHEQEGLRHAQERKVSSGRQRKNTFQSNDIPHQKSQNTSLKIAFQDKQTGKSKERCCSMKEFQDTVVLGRTSTGQSPYQCTVCRKSFNSSSNLLHHQHSHTAEKPYKCTQCWKSFSRNSTLTQHQEVHRGSASLSVQSVVIILHAAPASPSIRRLTKGRSPTCAHNVVSVSTVLLSWWLTRAYTHDLWSIHECGSLDLEV